MESSGLRVSNALYDLHIADNGLAALVGVDVFNSNFPRNVNKLIAV